MLPARLADELDDRDVRALAIDLELAVQLGGELGEFLGVGIDPSFADVGCVPHARVVTGDGPAVTPRHGRNDVDVKVLLAIDRETHVDRPLLRLGSVSIPGYKNRADGIEDGPR